MVFASFLAALLQTAQLHLGGQTVTVEIADTEESRSRGLMGRASLPDEHGMLFVFEEESPLSFWMKNTLVPLSIGFFSAEHILINTAEMRPLQTFPSHSSAGDAQYALEMPQGWFEKHQIVPGMKFTLINRSE